MERNARNNNSLAEISESKPKKGSKNNRKCNNQPDPNCFALFFSCVIFCVYLVAKLLLLHEPRSLIFGVLFQSLALPPAPRYTFYPVEALVSYLGLRCDGMVWLVILNYISERRNKKGFHPTPILITSLFGARKPQSYSAKGKTLNCEDVFVQQLVQSLRDG